jgi:ubiquinone/menaquinone biosynthesis C-methylase UbiE
VDSLNVFDAEQYRRESVERWEGAAAGWVRRHQEISRFAQPVADWLLGAVHLQPGQRVLDLAAGLGEIGIAAAAQVGPDGSVVIGDQAEAMVRAARERVAELGLENVEVRRLDAEWIDLSVGTVDAIVCRWGLMLMADPDTALQECRRVLAPAGRLALAVWAAPEKNPWALIPAATLIGRGLMEMPGRHAEQHVPGMFALSDPGALGERLAAAGFTEVEIDTVTLTRGQASFEEFWEMTLDMSPSVHDAVMDRPAAEIGEIRAEMAASLRPFTAQDGTLQIPAQTLVASASA